MTDTNTTQDAATKAAEEIVSQTGDVPGISTKWLAGVIRRHFPQPVAPESSEFAGHTPGERVPPETLKPLLQQCRFVHMILFASEVDPNGHGGYGHHVVTYGQGATECEQAADFGNQLKTTLGWPERLTKDHSPALLAERDALKAENARLREALGLMVHEMPIVIDELQLNRHRVNHREGTVEAIKIARGIVTQMSSRYDEIRRIARAALDQQ